MKVNVDMRTRCRVCGEEVWEWEITGRTVGVWFELCCEECLRRDVLYFTPVTEHKMLGNGELRSAQDIVVGQLNLFGGEL